jgi:glutathione S-transferase
MCTIPAIYDPSTGRVVADSVKIAEYLDEQYPDTPKLFPAGTRALQAAYLSAYRVALPAIWQFAFPATVKILNPATAEPYNKIKFEAEGIPRNMNDENKRIQ